MTNQINEEYIRVAAYYIWEQAGRPEGHEKEFWQQACNQLFNMNSGNKNLKNKSVSKSTSAKPAVKKTLAKNQTKKLNTKVAMAKPFYGIKK